MVDTLASFARKAHTAGDSLRQAQTVGVRQAALDGKRLVQSAWAAAGVNGGRLRGVGKRGAKLSVGFDMRPGPSPSALLKARGPAHLIESNTRPHDIKPRKKKGRAVVIPGVGPRARAHHPGTRGKHPWRNAMSAMPAVLARDMQKATHDALMKAFR